MTFRPMPVLSLVMLPALALLVWLGGWQFARTGEKSEAIAAWESRETASRGVPLEEALCDADGDYLGRAIGMEDVLSNRTVRFWGRSSTGEPVWRIMAAWYLPDCYEPGAGQHVLVQEGVEGIRDDRQAIVIRGMISRPPESGFFTPANDVEDGIFYRFEPEDLSQAFQGVSIYPDFWIIAYSDEMPPELAAVPPSQHLGYALTWWGMALALIAVYLVLHVQRGRLRFTRR